MKLEYQTSNAGEVPIAFASVGEGPPLVLLHGFSLSSEVWNSLGYLEPLAETGHRLILMDLRGHGQSGKPHEPAAYAGEREAEDVVGVLDAIGAPQASLMGYSRGGRLALDVAVAHPSRVERLVIGGAHGAAQHLGGFRVAVADDMDAWIAVIEAAGGPLPAEAKEAISANDVPALQAAVAQDRLDMLARLAAVEVPCLFYAGAEDDEIAKIRGTAQAMPRSRFFSIDGLNHMTALQRPDLVLPEIVSFLQQREGRGLNAVA